MQDETVSIPVRPSISVTALRSRPVASERNLAFVYAPGAGSSLDDPFGAHLAGVLPQRGIDTWRFQFPYMEAGKKRPDAPALLEETWTAVIEAVKAEGASDLVVGGRSMGGRIASLVVACGAQVRGLCLFAYPLAPPGRSATPRTEHLPSVAVPTLFVSGDRDAFGTPEQLREAVALVPDASLHILEGADHGFSTLKASGRTREDVWTEASDELLTFLERL